MTREPVPDGTGRYDVVIVGGGPAGLSAALMLGRARRSVLVVDAGEPRNAPAAHLHGFLSRDGAPPGDLLEAGRREAAGYGVEVLAGRVRSAGRDGERFAVTVDSGGVDGFGRTVGFGCTADSGRTAGSGHVADSGRTAGSGHVADSGRTAGSGRTADSGRTAVSDRVADSGRTVRARRLLVTTGITDELPDIPGLGPRWGRDILHCPYCHGWKVHDQPIGVLATGPMAVHQALLFRQWTDRLTLLLHTGPRPTAEESEQLAARDITVVPGEVTGLETAEDCLTGVRLRTGELIPLRALAVAPRAVPRAALLDSLGLVPTAHPNGLGSYIAAGPTGLTPVPGVWVAGNLADLAANVLASAASGSAAAGAINADLVAEDTSRAVRARRAPFSAAMEARVCELVAGNRRHGL
ncbi:hypothetical protein A6A06_17705 [Streptomyces sp. CB02923]|uniref:NAD(P)/FAD-dependent oxidoreductase n=1 Tax=Streptomyces sp. CB02923 TaxID=1718985 RepID=UPI00093EE85C|nr:NAD(P)/FAD-dependent oxidoreductase [Streptomyces sp. CB02923]OKI01348.1 hypothetical protein A6A06_17705 [Streptomyces sp. CB02923]